jgi:hypothetical protein
MASDARTRIAPEGCRSRPAAATVLRLLFGQGRDGNVGPLGCSDITGPPHTEPNRVLQEGALVVTAQNHADDRQAPFTP